jgi:hypothetical protein
MNRFISVLVDYIAFLLKTVLIGRQFIKIDLPVKLLEGFIKAAYACIQEARGAAVSK